MLKRFLLVIGLLLLASPASAADVASAPNETKPRVRLGDPGTVSLALEGTIGNGANVTTEGTRGGDLVVRPQLDVFVARRFSLGASLPLEYHQPTGRDSSNGRLGTSFPILRAGVLFPISERVQLWPGVQFGCGSGAAPGAFAPKCESSELWTAVDARLMFELFPRLYASVSPLVARVYFSRERDEGGTLGPVYLGSNAALSAVF